MGVVVLSPHLDDAVLSCWHLLDRADRAAVVNVFTAPPPPGAPLAWWDRLTGATDPAQRMRERRAEDARALGHAGASACALGQLDHQYRFGPEPRAAVAAGIAGAVGAGALVVAPAGLAGHPDHVLVRDAALALATAGARVTLYADLPHAIARGWPGWVTGERERHGDRVEAAWEAALAQAGLAVARLRRRVHALDAAARARKLRAVQAYATQRAALDAMAFAPLRDPRTLAWEVTWEVGRSALRGPTEAGGQALVADAGRDPVDEHG
jgi:hypothetical protein